MVNKNSLIVGFFVLAMFLSGCVVVVDERTEEPNGSETHLPDSTIAEIDAVGNLPFDNDKEQAYKRIAARRGLSAEAQVHLVEAALDRLAFDNARESVLLTLIANPDFSSAAERTILEKLDKLAFPGSRNRILKSISDRKNLA
jgi:hypothetical protein